MNVCVVGTRGFPNIEGGVEKHCECLYPCLRHDIQVTVFRRKPYVKDKSIKREGNIEFVDLPSTRIKGFEAVFHSFLATIWAIRKREDVIHYHNIGPALFAPLAHACSIPVVLTYHSPNYEHDKWGKMAKALLRFSEKVAMKCAARIIFVSSFQMEKYPAAIQRKSVFIPNGINSAVISEKHDFLDCIGVEAGRYILSVGRITPEKGFDTLIKGFRQALPQGYKLVIAGGVEFENGYMEKLRNLSQGLDVVFTGSVYGDDLAQLYTNAALYVLASNNEGFPLTLLEAASYGLDVAVSDLPATHLLCLNEEDYFPKGDPAGCAQRISDKLSLPQKRKYDLTQFNWKIIGERVSNIFDEVTKQPKRD